MSALAVPDAAIPGDVYPGHVFRRFHPPTRRRRMNDRDPLFGRMFINEGITVLKNPDGSYVTVASPSPEQVADAAAVYTGGHVYEVSLVEADALTAAGYEVQI
jgi:hypothetical protein